MTTSLRYLFGFAIAAVLALISRFSISPGTPEVYAPLPFLVIFTLMNSESMLDDANIIAAMAFVPVVFCIWCFPVLRGRATLPTRSLVLFITATILSAVWLAVGYPYGAKYDGVEYALGVTIVNVLCCVALSALAVFVRRRPSWVHNLTFHAALFAWLAWVAFPWLGELP